MLYAETKKLGRVTAADGGFVVARNPDTVLAPDIGYVRESRAAALAGTPGYVPGSPDLVIEVVSPSDTRPEVAAKTERWLSFGVECVIVVWSASRTMTVHRKGAATVTLESEDELEVDEVVPGFRLRVRDVFDS